MDTAAQSPTTGRPGFWRRNALVVAAGLVLVLTLVGATVLIGQQRRASTEQAEHIAAADARLAEIEATNAERIDTGIMESLGYSRTRVAEDAVDLERLLDTAFTWDSGAAYDQARTELVDDLGLDPDGAFLQQFMPPEQYTTDESGEEVSRIDALGMNMSAGSDPSIEVAEVRTDEYRYLVQADVSITSDHVDQGRSVPGDVTATRTVLLDLTIDGEGTITDVAGVPPNGTTRNAGS